MPVPENLFYIEKTDDKGIGLFANKKIFRGELIISEQHLFTYDRSKSNLTNQIEEKVNKLSIENMKLFYSLFDCFLPNSPTAIGIAETNSLPLGPDSNIYGLFPTIARINHSCVPNVFHSWNSFKKVETIYALKDIEENEEILTSYIDLYADRSSRQEQLKKSFRFDCSCKLCMKNNTDIRKSDIRRKVLYQLDKEVELFSLCVPEKSLVKAEQLLKYLQDEDMFYLANYVGRISYDVFQILFINKHNKKINKNIENWAQLAIDNFTVCSGNYEDCPLKKELEFFSNK